MYPRMSSMNHNAAVDDKNESEMVDSEEHQFCHDREAKASLDELVNFAKLSEPNVRACYSENIELAKEQLVEVILVDGGFIIELFRNAEDWFNSDAKLTKPWLAELVIMDLLLLENQLPFFFLEELFNKAFPLDFRGHHVPSFRELTYEFFTYHNMQKLEPNSNETIKHFTDLLRLFHLPRSKYPRKPFGVEGSNVLQYRVSELHEAGVKFKTIPSMCILDLKFSGHVLEISKVTVSDRFETLFYNMIALEQCHYPFDSYITDYALILDWLIKTTKDVDVLIDEGIIRNRLAGSNDVVKVFNGLGKNIPQVSFNSNYLDICNTLKGFYKDPCHRMKVTLKRDYYGTLKRDYCKTPWKTAASIAAVVLLILTLIQTMCSVLQVPYVARIFKI